jgi:hypothetical protein
VTRNGGLGWLLEPSRKCDSGFGIKDPGLKIQDSGLSRLFSYRTQNCILLACHQKPVFVFHFFQRSLEQLSLFIFQGNSVEHGQTASFPDSPLTFSTFVGRMRRTASSGGTGPPLKCGIDCQMRGAGYDKFKLERSRCNCCL